MKLRVFISLLCFLFVSQLGAQRIIAPKLVELDLKGVVYKNEWAIDLRLHENGFAAAFNTGEVLSFERTKYYQLELGLTKDIRERRQSKTSGQELNARSFYYGKINTLINVRGSLGFKKYLSEKAKRKGLAVGYSYSFGPSIALVKPYYLRLIYRASETETGDTEYRDAKYTEETASKFLNHVDISGASPWLVGWNEIRVIPGIQAKAATHFALGAFDKYVKAMEIGIMADLFIKKVDIMLPSETLSNKPYFIKLFASFQFGRRKN